MSSDIKENERRIGKFLLPILRLLSVICLTILRLSGDGVQVAPGLAFGLIGAIPWPKRLALKKDLPLVDTVVMAVLLMLCTASLVDGSFNPFLYFRF